MSSTVTFGLDHCNMLYVGVKTKPFESFSSAEWVLTKPNHWKHFAQIFWSLFLLKYISNYVSTKRL